MTAAVRFPSVPLAEDPDPAEHALWNDEVAAHLERMAEADLFAIKRPGMTECPCDEIAGGGS